MRHPTVSWLGLACAVVLTVTPSARAQTFFLEGSAFAGIERRGTSALVGAANEVEGFDPNGITAGGAFTVGTWLSPRFTARLEVGLPAPLKRSATADTVGVANRIPGLPYTSSRTTWDEARTVSALLGYHTRRHRGWQVGYLAGAAFVNQRVQQRWETRYPVLVPTDLLPIFGTVREFTVVPQVDQVDDERTRNSVSVAVGVDADVALSPRVSAVSRVRAIGLPSGISIRPGFGLRVSF